LPSTNKIRFVILFTSLIISYYITLRVDAPNFDEKYNRHMSIIHNTIEHPYKYRLLNPFITHIYYTVFKIVIPEKSSFLLAYTIQNFLVCLFLFFAAYKYLFTWFDETACIAGLLLFALIIPLTLTGWDTLGDLTTAGLMALGFYFINSGKENLLFPLLIIGAFNELQIILIILFYFFGNKDGFKSKSVWLRVILLTVTFIIVYVFIFILRAGVAGTDINTWSGRQDMIFNIHNPNFILLWAILIIPLAYFAFKDFSSKPKFLKTNILTVIPAFYVIAFFILARVREIDKALTIFLILIPLALFSLFPSRLKTNNSQT